MKLLLNTSQTILSAMSAVVLLHSTTTVQAANLRSKAPLESCSISAISYLQIPGEPPIAGGDEKFGCDDGIGPFVPLHLDKAQEKSLKALAANGELNFGSSKIDVRDSKLNADGSITMPPGKAISVNARENSSNPFQRRHLQLGTGNKHFLLFRVTDKDGLVYSHTPAQMSDNLFGTYGDSMNLKSQLTACSVGKYTVVPGGMSGYNTTGLESAPGVIDITIDVSLNNTSTVIQNAAMNKAKEVLGNYFNKSTAMALTTYAHHILFSLQACFQGCGWAAYAGVGSYYQVYQGAYYSHAGVQLHEHGHNLQLAHSGGLDGQTYTDHTCAMGNPLYGDDLGGMCYNPAKNWQLTFNPHPTTVISGWYDKQDFITVDTSVAPRSIQMIGIGEYNLQGDGVNVSRKAVVLKILNNSTTHQYVAFNSAKGANFQNDEADNLVTIVEYTGTGYSESQLKGYISEGQSFNTAQGRLVTVQCINTEVTPSLACVCVRDATQECPTDCTCPSRTPTDSPTTKPSKSPTSKPTAKPTNQPTTRKPTNPPTEKPTRKPTNPPTEKPTAIPTNPPTDKPTAPTTSPTKKPTRKPTRQPTNKPTAKPTNQPTAPTNQPTATPTSSPTNHPTEYQTGSPTNSPTNSPFTNQ